jgi:hypothetical protein
MAMVPSRIGSLNRGRPRIGVRHPDWIFSSRRSGMKRACCNIGEAEAFFHDRASPSGSRRSIPCLISWIWITRAAAWPGSWTRSRADSPCLVTIGSVHYRLFLRRLHEILAPRCYLEIGVRFGDSLSLSQCPSLGIDPNFRIDKELHTEVQLFKTTSDEYFSRDDPLAPVHGQPFDLAFIDGLHIFEFSLRDLINAERYSRPRSVIVFDDILPRSVAEASRVPTGGSWTGDIYHMIPVLERYREDLLVVLVDIAPTGLMLLLNLDPTNSALTDNYDEILAEFRHPDPQPVPPEVLQRVYVQPPERVLGSGLLQLLSTAGDDLAPVDLAPDLRRVAADQLGPAYGSSVATRL